MLFAKTETFMNIRRIITLLLTVSLFIIEAAAGPVQQTRATYVQPDGRSFTVTVSGDEWTRVRLTDDGCAIVKGEDGWWCYGTYDSEGRISSTGFHVGDAVPREVKTSCSNIPYGILTQKAKERRLSNSILNATAEATRRSVVLTKSGEETVVKRALVLLVEFEDVKFMYSKDDFERLMNEKDYKGIGSVKDYFEAQFGEGWEFSFDVSDIITLPRPVRYYGENTSSDEDVRPWDMVKDACIIADEKLDIDFSQYDQDGDSWVDNIYVFYAGKSESEHTDETELIWPHQYYIYSGERVEVEVDQKKIDRYACSAEISGQRSLTGIGPFCHEYAHTFGLVDLYDTDYDKTGGWAAGTWRITSLMDGGNYNNNSSTPPYFNCIEREMLGLGNPVVIEAGQTYTFEPIHINGTYGRLESGTPGEYYLFECRSNEGWDKYIGGQGMLVYHIDKIAKETIGSYEYSKWLANSVNADQQHQCADLIEADGRSDLLTSYNDLSQGTKGIFFPQSNVTALSDRGKPALTYWYGKDPRVSITGIRKDGNNIVFNTMENSELTEIPSVTDVTFTAFPDAVIIKFTKSDTSLTGDPMVEWRSKSVGSPGYTTVQAVEYEENKYAVKIEGLTSGNVSHEVQIRFESKGITGNVYRLPFMTKRKPQVIWPYIYIPESEVKQGEGIALHVVNATGEVRWEYNGKSLDQCKDFHLYPTSGGTLKAIVTAEDGSSDIIVKEITVKE